MAMLSKKFSISLWIDTIHRSLTDPVLTATVLGMTGILLALMVNVDFFLCLGSPGASS